jgi:hypothetical protein
MKYNPDQPRVPAGNSDGGQWTDGGGSGVRVSENDRDDSATVIPINYSPRSRATRPPTDAITLHAGDGTPFYAPPTADFQRKNGKFIHDYTNASNYGVGVLMNGVGSSWFETFVAGTGYGLYRSKPAYDANRVTWWYRGYQDAKQSRLPLASKK